LFTVKRSQTDKGTLVELQGSLEEQVNLEQQIGELKGELTINCRGVTRINSVGVKMWMRYFQALKTRGQVFRFIECPPALVEQLNLISNFACGGDVVSVLLPFSCVKCQNDFVANVGTAELKANQLLIPTVKCEKTDCGATFDDDPTEYLYFLED
jgi:anti-anti-sigma regulatory factor